MKNQPTTKGRILITGVAGFIGFHLAKRLLENGKLVVGIDNLNDYYDVNLKKARLAQLLEYDRFQYETIDLSDRESLATFISNSLFDVIIHMAAQAGVRYSLSNPTAYIDSNVVGFVNLIELAQQLSVKHFVFASSSSVYGNNAKRPFSVGDPADQPISLYGATKKANEVIAYAYAHLYRLPCTGLRLFTVYGPWGRPDMAYFSFTRSILAGDSIKVYNDGQTQRDFTYIDDVVEGVMRIMDRPPADDPPFRLYNIGNNQPVQLNDFIELLEQLIGRKADQEFLPAQPGDANSTHCDVGALMKEFGWRPRTQLKDGLSRFIDWYREYYEGN